MKYFSFSVSILVLTFLSPLAFGAADLDQALAKAKLLQRHNDAVGPAIKDLGTKANPDMAPKFDAVNLEDKQALDGLISKIEAKNINPDDAKGALTGLTGMTQNKQDLQKEVDKLPAKDKDAINKNTMLANLGYAALATQIFQSLGGTGGIPAAGVPGGFPAAGVPPLPGGVPGGVPGGLPGGVPGV